jgi:hypothetical protein
MDIEEDTMAEFVETCRLRAAEPVSFVGWLVQHLRRRPRRLGNADELPDRMRRDMGLAPADAAPRHYRDYLTSRSW